MSFQVNSSKSVTISYGNESKTFKFKGTPTLNYGNTTIIDFTNSNNNGKIIQIEDKNLFNKLISFLSGMDRNNNGTIDELDICDTKLKNRLPSYIEESDKYTNGKTNIYSAPIINGRRYIEGSSWAEQGFENDKNKIYLAF